MAFCNVYYVKSKLHTHTAVTADILLSHVDHVTSIARHANQVTDRLASMPCESVLQQMTATGSLTPYIRSTGLIKEDILVCSSVTGARQQSVSAVFGVPVSAPTGTLKITATEGTSSVPGHAAVIYAYGAGNRMTAFSMVDTRYFTDLMDSLDEGNHAVQQLRFGDGPVISGEEKLIPHKTMLRSEFRSDVSQAHLLVLTPLLSLRYYMLRNLLFLGPLSLLLTFAMLYMWRRWESRKMSLADEIRKGMADGEFTVHYQPVCETATGACSGAEALMRWQRPDGRTISPLVFIRAAEEEGLIVSLTQHLFGLIGKDVRNWQDSLTSAGADTPVLDTIVGLSKRLGLTTIAEGVTAAHQVDWLTKNQVPYVQGYHYGRPMPASDFYHWYCQQNGRNEA